jgi:hypothetical protein
MPISRQRRAAMSVSTQLGQTALTVIPRVASDRASDLVKPITPCLAAQ